MVPTLTGPTPVPPDPPTPVSTPTLPPGSNPPDPPTPVPSQVITTQVPPQSAPALITGPTPIRPPWFPPDPHAKFLPSQVLPRFQPPRLPLFAHPFQPSQVPTSIRPHLSPPPRFPPSGSSAIPGPSTPPRFPATPVLAPRFHPDLEIPDLPGPIPILFLPRPTQVPPIRVKPVARNPRECGNQGKGTEGCREG